MIAIVPRVLTKPSAAKPDDATGKRCHDLAPTATSVPPLSWRERLRSRANVDLGCHHPAETEAESSRLKPLLQKQRAARFPGSFDCRHRGKAESPGGRRSGFSRASWTSAVLGVATACCRRDCKIEVTSSRLKPLLQKQERPGFPGRSIVTMAVRRITLPRTASSSSSARWPRPGGCVRRRRRIRRPVPAR